MTFWDWVNVSVMPLSLYAIVICMHQACNPSPYMRVRDRLVMMFCVLVNCGCFALNGYLGFSQ